MAINTNVYGTPEQWVDTYYQQTALTNKNKKAWFGGSDAQTQFRGGVASGKLSYSEPLDYSLVYCGFGAESALSHCTYLGRDPENINNCKIIDTQDFDVSNYFFSEKTSQYGSTNDPVTQLTYIDSENLNRYAWGASPDLEWNIFPYLEPITVLNPHNVVLQVNVRCSSSLTGSCTSMGLGQYVQDHSSYPYIQYVYINPYWGNLSEVQDRTYLAGRGSVPRGGSTLTLQRLDNYTIPVENVDTQLALQGTRGIIVMGSYGTDRIETFAHAYTPFYTTEQGKEHIKLSGSYARIEYYDGVIEDILKTVACFGLYFTIDEGAIPTMSLTDSRMYIGLIDEDGVGRGRYLQGAQTVNAPQAASDFKDMHSIPYVPGSIDPTKYQNDTQFYSTWSSSAFTKMYVLTESQVQQLASELYTAVSAAPTSEEIERYNQSVFLTQNPIDCIISLKRFPIELPYSAAVPMKLGSYTTQVNAAPLLYSTGVYSFVFSRSVNNNLYQWFDKSFLDYEPYTKVELSIPFCGTVEIPTTYIYDYDTIDVKLIIDYITGACTAYIQARNITIDSVSGECAVSLPVNGIQSATLDSQIHSAATARNKSALTNGLGLIGGLAAVGIGIATGGIGTAVIGGIAALTSGANMITQDKNIEYELQHMQVPMKQVSGASGAINQSYDMRCKMRITRPKIAADYDAEVYADTIGFACLINTTVGNLSGLTVGDINLNNVAASDVEKQLIKNAFAGGVIL